VIILDTLLVGGIKFVLGKIADAVEAEMADDTVWREELLAAQMRLELGEITEPQFAVIERELLARIREIRERQQGRPEPPGTFRVTGVEATVLGKPSPAYFEAALEALDAEPELTWMVGDDLDSDVAGAQRYGLKTVLVRTGKFRPDELYRSMVVPDAVISSVAYLPEWLERSL